jgi:periplasmic divalent cation tolerance protein
MPAAMNAKVVLVTCGSRAEARRIAQAAVAKRLAACVNVATAPVESLYRWKGKVERAREFLLVIKTTAARLRELEEEVARLHGYDVPEFLVIGVAGGSRRYLKWLSQSVL